MWREGEGKSGEERKVNGEGWCGVERRGEGGGGGGEVEGQGKEERKDGREKEREGIAIH